jgi:hypothetical protein
MLFLRCFSACCERACCPIITGNAEDKNKVTEMLFFLKIGIAIGFVIFV